MRILRAEFFMCLFKHKQLICVIFILLIAANVFYLLFRSTYYLAAAKVLINPSREFLNLSPTGGQEHGQRGSVSRK
mgnify:CR=1 FL=1